MHGPVLHSLGWTVRIFERSPDEFPSSHMAGVCLGPDALRFLERFDRAALASASDTSPPTTEGGQAEASPGTPVLPPLDILATQLQSLDGQGRIHPFLRIRRVLSSWDALYFRLRANFDGFRSDYVPSPPPPLQPPGKGGGGVWYETGRLVVGIEKAKEGKKVRIRYRDVGGGEKGQDGTRERHEMGEIEGENRGAEKQMVADLVIGADGPNSVVRKTFMGETDVDRKYAGYLAWRRVVLEGLVSVETRRMFRENITYSILGAEGGHVIM